MNKAKRNIVVVGFTEDERNSISLPYLSETDNRKQIHYIDSLSSAYRYQGYLLIIDNSDSKSIVELDKKYRNTFNKYARVLLYNENYNEEDPDLWSGVGKIGREIFTYDALYFYDEWEEYKNKVERDVGKVIKYSNSKEIKLDKLYNYIKKYKTRKTSEISKDLNLSNRTIQRYMHDLNDKYHNIGYDYSLNEWYFSWS